MSKEALLAAAEAKAKERQEAAGGVTHAVQLVLIRLLSLQAGQGRKFQPMYTGAFAKLRPWATIQLCLFRAPRCTPSW
jgi:hypothetical protein